MVVYKKKSCVVNLSLRCVLPDSSLCYVYCLIIIHAVVFDLIEQPS